MKHAEVPVDKVAKGVIHVIIPRIFIGITCLGVTLQLQAFDRSLALCRNLQPYLQPYLREPLPAALTATLLRDGFCVIECCSYSAMSTLRCYTLANLSSTISAFGTRIRLVLLISFSDS